MGASCSSLFGGGADIFAFNEILTFVAPLAETQISTVVIVRRADGTRCAYKTICFAKERREKVEREAAAQRRVSHPNLVVLLAHEVAPTPNADVLELRLLFPFYEGGTLAEALERAGTMSEVECFDILAQLSAAIALCHERGVIHRDLKLTNVYRTADESWVLGDFGSALLDAETVTFSTREELGAARDDVQELTTPEYRAPEQVSLELGSRCGAAVDAWALGVALHQLAFGSNPFDSPVATLSERSRTKAEAGASSRLRGLLDALLERDQDARITAAAACELASGNKV